MRGGTSQAGITDSHQVSNSTNNFRIHQTVIQRLISARKCTHVSLRLCVCACNCLYNVFMIVKLNMVFHTHIPDIHIGCIGANSSDCCESLSAERVHVYYAS